ncbi:T9SS type B sorting domain-containing protein [Lewinella sp. W8]|uniref:T9SS type B sorting domain-containing protein n=1 Tax=Lewinella sp. W8 TaxID=2528208 RepID=UPI001067A3A4|nr:T9SS type B sorting domain-containing protein [Lewinella sp. W8]MTB52458.1 T9SS type B sorting domain-containing protein [Lewinella sp. W8]
MRWLICLICGCLAAQMSAQDFAPETVVCRRGSFTLSSPLTDGVAYQYAWERSFDGGVSWQSTGDNAPTLTISSPHSGIRYRMHYAPATACLRDPGCRQSTTATLLTVRIPSYSQGVQLCRGDTLRVGTDRLTTGGLHQTVLSTAGGCDSIVDTFIDLLEAHEERFFLELCPGEQFRGLSLAADTSLIYNLTSDQGCDSLLIYDISIAGAENFNIRGNTLICAGESTRLSAPGQYVAYRWTTGETSRSIEVAEAGTYGLTLTDLTGCERVLTVDVGRSDLNISAVDITPPGCPGGAGAATINLQQEGPMLFSFDGGNTFGQSASNRNMVAGNYRVVVENDDGCRRDTTIVIPPAPALALTPMTATRQEIERGDTVSLAVAASFPVMHYTWSSPQWLSCTDCPDPAAAPPQNMVYEVTATAAGGCSATATFDLRVKDHRRVYAPTAFSPNGDDQNDRWQLFTGPRAVAVSGLQIADRWGGVQFEQPAASLPPEDLALRWDGTREGIKLPAGSYYYAASIHFADGSVRPIRGKISLIR